jgi:1-pyrroline-5-carboxylate dehydrogenase
MANRFKITYATLSADNEALQSAFDEAVSRVKNEWLGAEVPMFLNGEKVYAEDKFKTYSPINTDLNICTAQNGRADHSRTAVAAAKAARSIWRATPWQERASIIRNIADKMSDNIMDMSALMSFEIGKSRLEALGEVEEAADLLRYYADTMENNQGFVKELGKLDPSDPGEQNRSVLKPYGVWVVISPFNFPVALSAAPIAAALVTGNTVVYKGALETPFSDWKVAELFAEAGLPPGVFNSVLGPDETVGQTLLDHPDVNGWTFTGSFEVGMKVLRTAASGSYPRPALIEMGGKNPAIVSKTADLDKAAIGIMRAAFGLTGQKCSACSRVYVQKEIYDEFTAKLLEVTRAAKVGDPTQRDTFMGSLAHKEGYEKFQQAMAKARADGTILTGGHVINDGDLAKGYFVEPTIVEGLPENHELVKNELFVPILHLSRVGSLEEAMDKANDTVFGLTAGFFGEDEKEIDWFFRNIQAGTVYANREGGATTGAWPGVQAFGGWKGSSSSGKGVGALYTLLLYMHEQSQTLIG